MLQSRRNVCFAGLELPVVHMKNFHREVAWCSWEEPSHKCPGAISRNRGHSDVASSLQLLTKSLSWSQCWSTFCWIYQL